jgi:hypothetical protein
LNDIELDFVEREATPILLMKLGTQIHLAGLSPSDTVSILQIFGVNRAQSTIHGWVHGRVNSDVSCAGRRVVEATILLSTARYG